MSDPDATLQPESPADPDGSYLPYSPWWAVGFGAVAGLAMRLIFSGPPGEAYSAMLSSFIIGSPAVVGIVTVYLAERIARRGWGYYFGAPALATILYVVGTLVILIEGWICAIVIIPMFAVVGGVAGLIMGLVCRITDWPRGRFVSCVAVLPLVGGAFEHRIPTEPRVRAQEREIFIAAPPEVVWDVLMDARDIQPREVDRAWMYRIGVPTPREGVSEYREGEHLRHIAMGKGISFDQVAIDWRENQHVTWHFRFSPASFPAGALDDHVRVGGHYFDVRESTCDLIPVPGGTRLRMRMSYRVSTHFNWYAGPVADFLVGDFTEVILDFYARRAAPDQAGSS
jgi:hypothetical protein